LPQNFLCNFGKNGVATSSLPEVDEVTEDGQSEGEANQQVARQVQLGHTCAEPVFLNVYGAQESIPRNEFRQPM
jgi:hypothetical protein